MIGKYIFKKRTEKHLTMEQLSDFAGCTKSTINDIEKGNAFPSVKLVIKIAEVFDLSENEKEYLLDLLAFEKIPERIKKQFLDLQKENAELRRIIKELKGE